MQTRTTYTPASRTAISSQGQSSSSSSEPSRMQFDQLRTLLDRMDLQRDTFSTSRGSYANITTPSGLMVQYGSPKNNQPPGEKYGSQEYRRLQRQKRDGSSRSGLERRPTPEHFQHPPYQQPQRRMVARAVSGWQSPPRARQPWAHETPRASNATRRAGGARHGKSRLAAIDDDIHALMSQWKGAVNRITSP